jgi:hypothetical protein
MTATTADQAAPQTGAQAAAAAAGRQAGQAASARRFENRVREWVFLRYVCGMPERGARAELGCGERQVYRYTSHLRDHRELLADELSHYFGPESVAEVIAREYPQPDPEAEQTD